jgi:CHAT domain-containing protein/tetratricopeptide (TPR) repeat protein
MDTQIFLNKTDGELKTWALAQDPAALNETFNQVWQQIRNTRLYAGQPRSADSEQSVALAKACLQIATDLKSEQLLGLSWRMLAYSLNANEQYEESLPVYDRAIEALDAEDSGQSARVRIGYVSALFHTGQYQKALAVASVAEDWFKKNKDEVGFARLCNNIANLYDRLGEHARACEYRRTHSELIKKIGDEEDLAKSYLNLGNSLAAMDQFEKADQMYADCENLSQKLGINELWVQASYNRAHLYYLRGRYADAFQSFSRLRLHFERSGSRRHHALCDLDEAEIYIQLNLPQDASALARRAAEEFKDLGLYYEEAKATAFLGVTLLQKRRYAAALEAFQTAQDSFASQGNLYWRALLDLYRSEVQVSLKKYAEALELAEQAKALFEQMDLPSKTILSLVYLGRIALSLNDVSSAEATEANISALMKKTDVPLLLFPCYTLFAEIAERRGEWRRAELFYKMAADDMELHQARLLHDDLKITFLRGKHQAYERLVLLALRKSNPRSALASAYTWTERAKSRGLIDLLYQHLPAVQSHADPLLLAKAERLREELNVLYARSAPECRSAGPLAFEIVKLKEDELSRMLREVSTRDPEYTSLQRAPAATIEMVQAMLPDQTTLVEYFVARSEVMAFVVSKSSAEVHRALCSMEQVVHNQKRLAFHLEELTLGDTYINSHSDQILDATNHHLAQLHRMLFAPIAGRIQTAHVTILPHGCLHLLPFHAFFDGSEYLMDQFEVSYCPSASVLKYCLKKNDITDVEPCLIGVSDQATPFVEGEIQDIISMFPGSTVLMNGAATRFAFTNASRKTSFLHIATHGTFRQDNPMFSGFKLADGWITALDLFSMTCQTNLVTLSGCKSGLAQVTGSDDLVGLMRGFMYAGARSLLLSQWNIDDECTAKLMSRFYHAWHTGSSKSRALNTAMKSIRKEYPNPFYWAPFLLVGKQ